MTDYYDELKLSVAADTAALLQELNKLESLWRRREVMNPEKASKMVALILEARKEFKDEEARRNYDLRLAQSKRKAEPHDSNAERLQTFSKWRDKAITFYDDGQYDLAQSALERALSYMPVDYEDSFFFNQAALIYVDNNNCNAAMNYVNKAIVIDSSIPDFYLTKGLVFNGFANGQYVNATDRQNYHTKSEGSFLKAHDLAAQQNVRVTQANAAGALALYYNMNNNESKAEAYAQEAVDYGETWGNGSKVLQIIANRREAQERSRQEALRRQEEEKRRAEELRQKYEEQKQEEERKKREHDTAVARRRIFYIIGWLVWVTCQAVNGPIFFYSLAGAFPKFMTAPLFLILAIIGTTVPAYAEAAYVGYRGFLGSCCIFSIIMYCVYTQYVNGVGFFALLIVLIVLQIISWKIGKQQEVW